MVTGEADDVAEESEEVPELEEEPVERREEGGEERPRGGSGGRGGQRLVVRRDHRRKPGCRVGTTAELKRSVHLYKNRERERQGREPVEGIRKFKAPETRRTPTTRPLR
jgi:hypothetical protein